MQRWLPRLLTVVLSALLAGIVAYWWLKVAAGPPQAPARTLSRNSDMVTPAARDLVALFGGATGNMDASVKVIAGNEGGGRALLSLNDAPAKPYAVGASVAPGLVLKGIEARAVLLERNGAPLRVNLAVRPSAGSAMLAMGAAPPAQPNAPQQQFAMPPEGGPPATQNLPPPAPGINQRMLPGLPQQ
jgi:general secretion pathway protein C